MSTEEKGDSLTLKVRELTKEIRKKVEGMLSKEYEEFKKQGKYPWEEIWLSQQDIVKLQKVMKKRDRVVFGETIALFLIFTFLSYGLYVLMKMFLLP